MKLQMLKKLKRSRYKAISEDEFQENSKKWRNTYAPT